MCEPTKTPYRIWLQVGGEGPPIEHLDDVTWCRDKIDDGDVEYVRADAHKALVEIVQHLITALALPTRKKLPGDVFLLTRARGLCTTLALAEETSDSP